MAEQAEQVSTIGLVDTKRPKRRQYSKALKRQMVAETQVPGASVSIVARRHDVNRNQLFRWPIGQGEPGTNRVTRSPAPLQNNANRVNRAN